VAGEQRIFRTPSDPKDRIGPDFHGITWDRMGVNRNTMEFNVLDEASRLQS